MEGNVLNDTEISERIFDQMSRYLFGMGIYTTMIGFHNLIDTITYIVTHHLKDWSTGEIFGIIGARSNKTASAIEKSIKLILTKCENSGSIVKLNEYFGYSVYWENSSLSASEIVALFVRKINAEIS